MATIRRSNRGQFGISRFRPFSRAGIYFCANQAAIPFNEAV
ncbi:hypothetical protein [Spirosoma arboris]|nr:hypothetical protein [Spirosoma arboris]